RKRVRVHALRGFKSHRYRHLPARTATTCFGDDRCSGVWLHLWLHLRLLSGRCGVVRGVVTGVRGGWFGGLPQEPADAVGDVATDGRDDVLVSGGHGGVGPTHDR